MPELPEVQTIVDDLIHAGIRGKAFASARVFWPRTIHTHTPARFAAAIRGRKVEEIARRGKYILFHLSRGPCLLVHLRMTGRFVLAPPRSRRTRHDQVILRLAGDGRQLRYYDPRKFGRFYLVDDPAAVVGHLGPEPLSRGFTAAVLGQRLAARRRHLKPLLLDQGFLAGLGNIYVDEALWQAGLHPLTSSSSLNATQVGRLHRAIRKVLRKGLANFGTTLGRGAANYYSLERGAGTNEEELRVFRRQGHPCPRCRTTIQRLVVGQRGTHICVNCQK